MIKKIKQIKISNRTIYLSFTIFFFLFFIYLSIPALYTFNKLKPEIEKKLFSDFGLKIDLKKGKYVFFPSPRIKFNNSKIFNKKNKLISNKNHITIPLHIFNLIGLKNLKYSSVKINNATINIKDSDFLELNQNIFNVSDGKKIVISKSRLLINGDNNEPIVLILLKNMKIFSKKGKAKVISNMDVFNTIVNINYEKNNYFQLSIPEIVLSSKTIFNNKDPDNTGKTIIRMPKNLFTINHHYKNNKILIKNSKVDLDFSKGNFKGLIDLNPFFFDLNFTFDSFNFLTLLENKNEFIKNFNINNKINGKLNIHIKELSSKLKNNVSSIINLEFKNSNLDIVNLDLLIEEIVKFRSKGTLYFQDNKKNMTFNTSVEIENYKKFYSIFLINKQNRVKNLNLYIKGVLDINNKEIILNSISNNMKEFSLKTLNLYNSKIKEFIYNKSLLKMINTMQIRIFINSLLN